MCLLNLVPLWSTDCDTEASSSVSYFVLCFLGMPELNIPHLTPFCKTGLAKYFLWFFLPLETKNASIKACLFRGWIVSSAAAPAHTKSLLLPWDTSSTTFHLSPLPNQPVHLGLFTSFPSPHSLVGKSGRQVSHTEDFLLQV